MTQVKRPITADDLLTLQAVGDPQISPDAKTVAFVRTTTDTGKNTYRGEIWIVPADSSRPARRFTGGAGNDSEPRWSPDMRLDRLRRNLAWLDKYLKEAP